MFILVKFGNKFTLLTFENFEISKVTSVNLFQILPKTMYKVLTKSK